MSKARKIMTYLMVGMMILSNFQNRLYAEGEAGGAASSSESSSSASSSSSDSGSSSSSSDGGASGGGSSEGGNSGGTSDTGGSSEGSSEGASGGNDGGDTGGNTGGDTTSGNSGETSGETTGSDGTDTSGNGENSGTDTPSDTTSSNDSNAENPSNNEGGDSVQGENTTTPEKTDATTDPVNTEGTNEPTPEENKNPSDLTQTQNTPSDTSSDEIKGDEKSEGTSSTTNSGTENITTLPTTPTTGETSGTIETITTGNMVMQTGAETMIQMEKTQGMEGLEMNMKGTRSMVLNASNDGSQISHTFSGSYWGGDTIDDVFLEFNIGEDVFAEENITLEVSKVGGEKFSQMNEFINNANITLKRAFDIKFMSDGTEIQPQGGKNVEITFSLYNTDINLDKVKVYHFTPTDAIEIPYFKSGDMVTIQASEFSPYGIAEFTQEEPQERTFDTITISKPAGYTGVGPDQIVIMDRNLGATSNDITSSDSYGYYFQWGNNYGFPYDGEITTSSTQVDASSYGPRNPYSSDTFIIGNADWSSVQNDNLRGGANDSASNNRGLDDIEDTATERQGPCPDGYHVPSAGEWNKVVEYRAFENGQTVSGSDLKSFYNVSNGEAFRSALKIPFAGYRYYAGGSMSRPGRYEVLWSSSPYSQNAALLVIDGGTVNANGRSYRANGLAVRCFQNLQSSSNPSGLTLSFDSDGGSSVDAITGLEAGDDISGYRPKKDPQKAGQMFLGWFDANGERFMFEGKTISEDMTLTAHWAPFNDLVYTGIIDGVLKTIVLMDRNFGATSTDLSSTDSDGYFYQWGNNFGFDTNVANIQFTTAKADVSGYGPENPYYGEKFIKQTDWTTSEHQNLRGGEGDDVSNNFDTENARTQRQGPCPEGYYIPSLEEGNELVMLYFANNGIDSESASGLFYPNTVGQGDGAKYPLSSEQEADFRETFKLPQSGMIRHGGNKERHRTDTKNNRQQSFLATSTSHGTGKYVLMQTNTGNKGTYVNVGGWVESIGDATPIRCFKSITETPIDPDPEDVFTVAITTEGSGSVDQNSVEVTSGAMIEFTGNTVTIGDITITATPETTNAQYAYDFDEWENTCGDTVTNSCTITAKFSSTEREYTITFKNWNQNGNGHDNLRQRNYHYGETPIYDGVAPTRESDAEFDYTFDGWTPEIHSVDGHNTYTATYTSTKRSYTVSWKHPDGSALTESEVLEYGTVPEYKGTTPTKASAEGRTYTFKGWTDGTEHYSKDEPLPAITGETTFTAEFDETVQTYPIRFIGFNGEVLQESNLAYGETPAYTGATPTRDGRTFAGWDSEITVVDGAQDYTAVFEACTPCDAGTGASCSLSVVANSCTYTTSCNAGYGDMTGNATATPSCTLQTYTITYEGITGANNFDNPSEYTILTPTMILAEPQKEGHTFKGWTPEGIIEQGSSGPKTFTANWEIKKSSITFDFANGEEPFVISGNYGDSFGTPDQPTKDGNTFSGWDKTIPAMIQEEPLTITAIWDPCTLCDAGTGATCSLSVVDNQCTYSNSCIAGYTGLQQEEPYKPSCTIETYDISYKLNGGQNHPDNPLHYTIESDKIDLQDPTKEGYDFQGWEPKNFINHGSTGLQEFEAIWAVHQYKMSFVTNTTSGTIIVEDSFGTPLTAPTGFTKEGAIFSGWDKEVPSTIPSEDQEFVAQWTFCEPCENGVDAQCSMSVVENQCHYETSCSEGYDTLQGTGTKAPTCSPKPYRIQYDLKGGENNENNPDSYDITSGTIELLAPTKVGNTFNGWSPRSDIPQGSTGEKSFTANWIADTYTITFVSKNSSVPAPITGDFNASVKDKWPQELLTRSGYTFVNWVVSGTYQNYTNGARYNENTEVFKENITLKPKWKECTPCKESTGFSCSMSVVENQCHYETSCSEGYEVYENAGNYNQTCKPLSYEIEYELNGGVNHPQNPSSYTIESEDIILENPTKVGHTFSMWNEGNIIPSGSTGKKTFEAIWDKNKYQIVFNLANGSDPIVDEYDYQDEIKTPAMPTKEGHTFSGWDKEIPSTMPAELLLITAQWNACMPCEAETGAECTIAVEENACVYQTSCKPGYSNLQGTGTRTPSCKKEVYTIDYQNVTKEENNENNPDSYDVESGAITLLAPTKKGYTFNGWNPEGFIDHGSIGNKTFTANWKVDQYTITFDFDNGTAPKVISGDYDSDVQAPAQPTKEGNTFSGWSDEIPAKMPDTNPTITALWDPCTACKAGTGAECVLSVVDNQCTYTNSCKAGYTGLQNATEYNPSCEIVPYTINYVLSGGANGAENPSTYTVESDTISLSNPSRTGYTFNGWNPEGFITHGSTGNKVFTVNWKVNQYKITFNFDNGTEALIISGDYDSEIQAPAQPTKEGNTFSGWDAEIPAKMPSTNPTITALWDPCTACKAGTGAECSLSVVDNQCTYTNSCKAGYTGLQNATEYNPFCEIVSYTINYVGSGVEGAGNPSTYTVESDTIILAEPTREGYTFAGWTPSNTIAHGSTGEKTFTANWTVNQYTMTFDTVGGSKIKSLTLDYGAEIPEIANPTKEGYTFAGWETEMPETMPAENLTMVAKWTINSYEITWKNANGETLKVELLDYGTMPAYTGDTPEKEADKQYTYTFSHWEPVLRNVDKNQTYTAIYSKTVNQYTVTFRDQNNAILLTGSYPYGTEVRDVHMPEAPYQTGYKFVGWKMSVYMLGGMPQTVTSNLEFVPDYVRDEYTITYILDDTVYGSAPATFQSQITPIVVPEKQGYTFSGWTPRLPFNMPAMNLTVYGEYVLNKHWAHFNTNGGNTIAPREIAYDATIEMPENPTKAGRVFDGWDKDITKMPDEDVWFNAQWTQCTACDAGTGAECTMSVENNVCHYETSCKEGYGNIQRNGQYNPICFPIPYTILYHNVTEEENNENNPESYDVESGAITILAPTRTGYTFRGWTPNNKIPQGSTGEKTFTATWTPNQYFIKFDGNGGVLKKQRITGDYESSIEMPENPEREGYTFLGWDPEIPATMPVTPETGLLITAQWEINQYTITFDTDGGTPIESITANYGTELTAPAAPIKAGHKFESWDKPFPSTMPAENLELKALYDINLHTITFDTQGGTEIEPITTGFDYAIIPPANPTRTGYTFAGWDTVIPDRMPNENMTITASWTINTHTITFYTGEGTSVETITGEYNSEVIAPADPTWTGHTFSGWDQTIPSTMPDEDLIITALWTINSHRITFDTDGGTHIPSITGDYGTPITKPADPTKAGYTFSGWNRDIPDTMPDEDLTITGLWTINQYTFTFVTSGGTQIAPITQDYHTEIVRPADPTWTGHTFKGWDQDPSYLMPDENRTYTALWDVDVHTITFDTQGGTEISKIKQEFGTPIPAPADPTKVGYTFSGWDKEIPSTMPAEDMTITALWTINQYSVIFDLDGGTGVDTITQDYDTFINLPADPTKEGYTFVRWDGTIPANMPSHNVNVKALWSINQHTISFNTKGGTDIEPINAAFGTPITRPADPIRTGYTFSGWNKEIPETMPDENVKITAQWILNEYTLTFDSNGGTPVDSITQGYDTEIVEPADPTRTGYDFKGWSPRIPARMPLSGGHYVAQWTPNGKTPYIVYHKQETTQNNGTYVDYEIFTGTAETASEVTPEVKTYEGFESPVAQTITIKADGSSEVIYKYPRKQITLTFDTNGGTSVSNREGKYGTTVTEPATTTKEGYHFVTWTPEVAATFPAEDETYTAKWQANTYHIDYELGDGVMEQHQPTIATFDMETTIDHPTRTGYTFVGWKITGMDRTLHTYGEITNTQTTFTTTETNFKNLTATDDATVTFTAQWTPKVDTEYTVKHHKAKLGGEGYTIETETLTGKTNTVTHAVAKEYEGFSQSGSVTQDTISADGSTVIDIYYKRNSYTVTFDTVGGNTIDTITAEYEAPIHVEDPTREGYIFSGWDPSFSATMPVDGETYTAQWTPKKYHTLYALNGGTGQSVNKVVHYDETFTVNNPIKVGYTFEGWRISVLGDEMGILISSGTKETEFKNLTATGNGIVLFNAQWSANLDTEYTVNHHKENLEGSYDIETETLTGTTEGVTNAVDKDYEGFSLSGKVVQEDIAPDGSTVIDIYYKRNTYTLTFDANGGEKTRKVKGKYGTGITAPADPTWTGYAFDGWDKTIPSTMPAEDMTITAQWTAMPFTITFDSNGGTEVAAITQNYGTEITAPADPTRIGHIFNGWQPKIPAVMPAENLTLTAQWEAKLYKVTFDSDGGTEVDEVLYPYGASVIEPTEPRKEGYTFVKWNPDLPETMPARDVIETAQWSINQYTITFDTDGGTEIAPITLNYNAKIRPPKEPKKKDHTFSGWNVEIPKRMPAKNMTITAQWNACEQCKESTGANCQLSVINNQCTYKTSCKEGYHEITGAETATPKCTPIIWEITYHLNDNDISKATNHSGNIETYTIEDSDFTLLAPERKGYIFKGWLDEKERIIETIRVSEKKDRNLTAKWEAKTIELSFDKQGGTGGTNKVWFKYGNNTFHTNSNLKSPISTINKPTRAGYTFQNYHAGAETHGGTSGEKYVAYYNEEGSFTPFASDLSTDVYDDSKLYAEWEANKIHVTLDPNKGTGGTEEFWYIFDTKEYFADEDLTQPLVKIEHPTRTGYTFEGYGDKVSYNHSGTRIELDSAEENTFSTISSDTTLKAQWSANTIKITLDANGGTGGTSAFYYKFDTKKFYSDADCTHEITKIERPTRAGYTFVDYRIGDDGERYVAYDSAEFADDLVTEISENTTLKAKWSANTIKITLDKEQGTGGTDHFYYKFDTQKFYADEDLQNEIEEIEVPTKEGYSFVSYDLSGENYITLNEEGKIEFKSDLSSTFSEDTTLHVHWGANKIHIHLDNEEGNGEIEDFWYYYNTATYYSDEAATQVITEIPHPTRTGYLFKDYYSEDKSQRFVSYEKDQTRKKLADDDIYKVISEDATLKARWTPKTIKVSLNSNGGTGGTSAFWFKYDEVKFYSNENLTTEITTIQQPRKEGYTFINYHGNGEHGAVSGNIYLSNTETPFAEELVHDIYEDATLIAEWGSNPYIVRYVNSANEEESQDKTVSYDQEFPIMQNHFTRTGYTFSGWIDEHGVVYQPMERVKNLAETGIVLLKTIWEANEYTVRFLSGGANGEMDPQTFIRDETGNLNVNVFTKAGYTFKNWKTADGKTFSNGATIKNLIDSGTIELTAQWEVIKSTSRSSGGGGGGSSMKKDNCPNGDHSNSYYDGKCEKDEKSDNTHGAAEEKEDIESEDLQDEVIDGKKYSKEDISLYQWARKHKLTSMETIGDFRGDAGLTRAEMAKIISIYATGYVGKVEKNVKACKQFEDITKIKGDLHGYIISACNLGFMGRSSDGKKVNKLFNPHSQVTKAEALTIISRVFRENEYANKKGEERYEGHVRHLIEIGVVADDQDINEPFARKDFYGALKKLHTLDF